MLFFYVLSIMQQYTSADGSNVLKLNEIGVHSLTFNVEMESYIIGECNVCLVTLGRRVRPCYYFLLLEWCGITNENKFSKHETNM
jgi:hypothetical protein